jgi:hypothetical protein
VRTILTKSAFGQFSLRMILISITMCALHDWQGGFDHVSFSKRASHSNIVSYCPYGGVGP